MTKLLKLAGASALLYLAFAIPAPAQINNYCEFHDAVSLLCGQYEVACRFLQGDPVRL